MNRHHKGNQLKRIFGALKNGGAEARMGIFIRLIAPITRFVDWIAPGGRMGNTDMNARVCILVGPPRSGSTVIYQAIAGTIPCIPYTNLHYLFPHHGTQLLRQIAPKRGTAEHFSNFRGYTASLADVNEGNQVFEWAHQSMDIDDPRSRFGELAQRMNPGPGEWLLFKNVRAFDGVEAIYNASRPHRLVFIRIRRNCQDVIESSLSVYRETGTFHPVPKELINQEIGDPLEFAVKQITGIERVLDDQFSRLPPDSKFEIQYEDFCRAPYRMLEILCTDYLDIPREEIRRREAVSQLRASSRKKVSAEESARIQELLRGEGIMV